MTHVVINAHLLSGQAGYRQAGIHRYIDCLLKHLDQLDQDEPDMRYSVLLGRDGPPPDLPLPGLRSRWPTGRAPIRVMWEQAVQPVALRRIGADLLHAPAFVGPIVAPCPIVITIHDLSFIRFPRLFRPANRLYLTWMTRLSARRARRLIAVSAHAAAESVKLLGVPTEKIDVVYHGVDPMFRPLPASDIAAFRRRQALPARFILFVGTLEPRKNLTRLVEAFARIRRAGVHTDVHLILAGGKGWLYDELFARVEALGLADRVTFPGYVAADALPLWYNAASIVAYPSIYEGFGLPVLEALACGAPTLTSNLSSLPEAAGDAAVLVDPYDVNALAEGLDRLLNDQALRRDLQERGPIHASRFRWARTARETANVYRRALADDERRDDS